LEIIVPDEAIPSTTIIAIMKLPTKMIGMAIVATAAVSDANPVPANQIITKQNK
jgi:hypothetical protein